MSILLNEISLYVFCPLSILLIQSLKVSLFWLRSFTKMWFKIISSGMYLKYSLSWLFFVEKNLCILFNVQKFHAVDTLGAKSRTLHLDLSVNGYFQSG